MFDLFVDSLKKNISPKDHNCYTSSAVMKSLVVFPQIIISGPYQSSCPWLYQSCTVSVIFADQESASSITDIFSPRILIYLYHMKVYFSFPFRSTESQISKDKPRTLRRDACFNYCSVSRRCSANYNFRGNLVCIEILSVSKCLIAD